MDEEATLEEHNRANMALIEQLLALSSSPQQRALLTTLKQQLDGHHLYHQVNTSRRALKDVQHQAHDELAAILGPELQLAHISAQPLVSETPA